MPSPFRSAVTFSLLLAAFCSTSQAVHAETRITYKSATAGTAYHEMGAELSEAIDSATSGQIILAQEESQGSVQNVMEVMARQGNYVFTTPSDLVEQALTATGPFTERPHPRFQNIRGLFPLPAMTMHFILGGDDGVVSTDALKGKHILIGRGTFSAREAARYFTLFGLDKQIRIADATLGSGPEALKNGQIDGFVTASSFPTPNIFDVAASMPISMVSLSDEQIDMIGTPRRIIPGGTYPGVNRNVQTTSLPVMAYTTTQMDDDLAYTLTRTFWEVLPAMAAESSWWSGITPELLGNMAGKLHAGALRYYEEVGIDIPEALR
ncbi:TAXI family TRAP transporter solute-binding subunit [Halomonas aquamarina]|uniref:TAXI family TRAP transporter solute-binding subunit n=1 Tax=Vreelandella aquamarina TaxID=77097 RepID=A0ACC5VXE7_9GAMM|nr:TAXI family TRAP transporter solute-binding subunit [Halomonas aquamarina]MBZ5488762.1 TAXI family TRAP transporter solute-binding subunit [Halomonas aquamarina]